MKKLFIISLILITGIIHCLSQENHLFLKYWAPNYHAALDSSKETSKPILIVFSGSDWCKPCIKLRTKIIDTEVFIHYAKENLILFNADFPYHKKIEAAQQKQNEQLAEKFNKEGAFPKLVLIDKNEKVLWQKGYMDVSTDEFIKELSAFVIH